MPRLIISEENLRWLWGKKFEKTAFLTVDEILELTIERGMELEELLPCLEEGAFPGIFQKVTERFMNLEVRKMLPEQILNDPEFKKMLSDLRGCFGTEDEDVARDSFLKHYLSCVDKESPENVKRAMIAYAEFGLGDFRVALAEAGFAVNESQIPDFGYELDRRTLTAQNALVKVAKAVAKIVLEVACEMQASAAQ